MLRGRDDVGSDIADTIRAKTTMSPSITGHNRIRNPNIETTIRIGMPIVLLRGNLGLSMCAIV